MFLYIFSHRYTIAELHLLLTPAIIWFSPFDVFLELWRGQEQTPDAHLLLLHGGVAALAHHVLHLGGAGWTGHLDLLVQRLHALHFTLQS